MTSWCPRCGYYPALGSDQPIADVAMGHDDELEETDQPAGLLQALPVWVWIALAGVLIIFGGSVAARLAMENAGDDPGVLGWPVLLVGLTVVLSAHGLALRAAMATDPRISINDGLIAWFTVWQSTISDLPQTRRRIWCLAWGGTACFCAVAIFGGLTLDWLLKPGDRIPSRNNSSGVVGAIAESSKEQQPETGSLEESLQHIADGNESGAALLPSEEEKVLTGTIFGFQSDRRGVPKSFLFSGITGSARQHVATIATSKLPEEFLRKIVMRLHNTIRRSPATPTVFTAVWVEPLVDCRIRYDSVALNGMLMNPVVVEVMRPVEEESAPDSGKTGSERDEGAGDNTRDGSAPGTTGTTATK